MRKIVFWMPRACMEPAGGFKIVFEYANRLAKDGFPIEIVYPMIHFGARYDWKHAIAYRLIFLWRLIFKSYKPAKWFHIEDSIQQSWLWKLENYQLKEPAVIVATAIETAYSLQNYQNKFLEDKFYFIQDFENWTFTDEQVQKSYHFSIKKIVISQWLKDIIEKSSETAILIPNGFDFDFFKVKKPIKDRNRYEIICMYHKDHRKDLPTAFKAFDIVKEKIPELHVTLFGVFEKPELPSWYDYYQRPSKKRFNELYNNAAIYVGSSQVEGWGLTVGEAMQCGCAVACTDNKGYLEMAKDGVTALVSPVKDYKALAENIIKLIEDDQLRHTIAQNGNEFIHEFDIEKSYLKIKSFLNGIN
ncbi:glycosyltransferase family 4 protein [Prevotella sp.]|uniref:glycosyltransferase family 4 protein n=1 Tax=Prevotella sp. TaxID=59823 RepID=UPI001CB618F5|nr:glycosyltransferase family 4 protein [Prevotella sp.]MBF1639674.1 glycosyltransferase family 4 protein [Prevotella sp.]